MRFMALPMEGELEQWFGFWWLDDEGEEQEPSYMCLALVRERE